MKPDQIFQFKITLNDSKPSIWRRIIVPADYTFFELHCAIQNAMGWTDSHLHAFRFANKNNKGRPINIATPMPDDDECGHEKIDERLTRIADYFGKISKQCVYDYDFGDSWEHMVVLEKTLLAVKGAKYPQCVAGKNACPPDDCGGVWGYMNLIEVLKNPKHPDHADMLDWLCIEDPREFDPSDFDPNEVKFENTKKRLAEWNKGFGKPAMPSNMIEIKTPEDDIFESSAMIGSSAGSKNGKLRHFIIFSWEKGGVLPSFLRKCLNEAVEKVANEAGMAEIEKIEYGKGYVLLTVLVSPDKAVGEIADDTMILANGTKPFLRFHYYVSNVRKPSKKVIADYLNGLK